MYRHLFKLIWNKRKQNILFLSEIFISFLVVFAVFSMLVFYYFNYIRPAGFSYNKVWNVSYSNPLKTKDKDTLATFYGQVKAKIASLPEIKHVSYTSANFPYSNSMSTSGFDYKGKNYDRVNHFTMDEDYDKVMSINLMEGRWFKKEDGILRNNFAVINSTLKKEMFGDESAIGAYLGNEKDENRTKIIGVVEDIKSNGDFWPAGRGMFKLSDSSSFEWYGNILIKVSNDADAAFESKLSKILAGTIPNSNIEISHLSDLRKGKNGSTIIPMVIFIIIAGFLIINVALGLFGVLWYNINQRKGEIGLRRAIGATGVSVSGQLVAESMILATLSIVLGAFFAIQLPLLNVFNVPANVYLTALLISVLFIYLLVILCSLYPGKQAAAIHPAIALHED
ncbi:MAG: FtsX-like permease family protein [Pedobacter sp.]|nr:MAG: FtsX-like permease family protein [Pedobacter sp.]